MLQCTRQCNGNNVYTTKFITEVLFLPKNVYLKLKQNAYKILINKTFTVCIFASLAQMDITLKSVTTALNIKKLYD